MSKVEKIKICKENPKEPWTQNKKEIEHLEEEISELRRRNCELEQLTHTEDNLHFLQAAIMAKGRQTNG